MRLPIFQDVTSGMCGEHVGIVRAMFFNEPKEQGKEIDWHQGAPSAESVLSPAQLLSLTGFRRTADREGPNNLPPLREADGNCTVWTALDPCTADSAPLLDLP